MHPQEHKQHGKICRIGLEQVRRFLAVKTARAVAPGVAAG